MKSIMNSEKGIDFLTGLSGYTEEHHIFFGNPGRKNSEKYGLKVYLFPENHRGALGPHHNRAIDLHLKRLGQIAFERKLGSREEFIQIFGRSYLPVGDIVIDDIAEAIG